MASNNLRKGDRAEYLTQAYLTSISFSNPTYRQEDYGIDFTCTLIEKDGTALYPTDVFAVQVKSNKDSNDQKIVFKKTKKQHLKWLFNSQIPYFLAWVDEENTKAMYLYSISQIWYLEVLKNRKYKALEFEYDTTKGTSINGFEPYSHTNDTYYFKVGKPFLTFEFDDLKDGKKLEEKKKILAKVIKIEKENIMFRNLKLPIMRWLHKYVTDNADSFEFGWAHFSDEAKFLPINKSQDILTHIGHMLIALAQSYKLNNKNEEYHKLKEFIVKLPQKNTEVDGISYNYKSFLETMGFI